MKGNDRRREFSRPSRRNFLQAGVLGGLGLTLPGFLRRGQGSERAARADSAILIWLNGGLTHHDTFDPKPDAVAEIRGEMGTIATSVAGVRFADSIPHLARQMRHLAVIRSVTHPNSAHDAGQAHMLSGYNFAPGHNYPSIGAVVGHEVGARGGLPPYLVVPNESSPYLHAGHLGSAHNPFAVGGNPNDPQFQVRDVEEAEGITPARSRRRQALLHQIDEDFRRLDAAGALASVDRFTAQAYDLIRSPKARAAFDLNQVDDRTRDRYGRTQLGQSCLLARRLVEAGVPCVTVSSDDWDHHQNLYPRLRGAEMLPAFDRAFAALLEDLAQRGRLDSTLVVFLTEFGRTPRLNTMQGRDHWSRAFSVALAGGGVRGGQVIGASDDEGAMPKHRPVTPEDVAHSIYLLLGLDPEKELPSTSGRRIPIVRGGQFIRELTA
jgi:uncharacterized protein (DUF1501 family)